MSTKRTISRVIRHPSLVLRFIDRKLKLTNSAKIGDSGERLVVKDWQSALESDSYVVLMHIHRYLWVKDFLVSGACLDAGCGSGYGTNYLAQSCPIDSIVGVDIDEQAIKYAQSKYIKSNLQFQKMDVTKMVFPDNSFDYVLTFDVLEHLNSDGQERFLNEIVRILKPKGTAFIGCPNGEKTANWKPNPFHLKELTKREFREILHRHFSDVKVQGQDLIYNGERQHENLDTKVPNLTISNFAIFEDGYMGGLLSICKQPTKSSRK